MLAGYALSSAVRPLIALAQSWTQVFTVRVRRSRRQGHPRRAARRDARGMGDADSTRGQDLRLPSRHGSRRRRRRPAAGHAFLFFYPGEYRTLFALTIIPGAIAVALIFLVKETTIA